LRFGDPETQPLLIALRSDLLEVMLTVSDGKLDEVELKWDRARAGGVAASRRLSGKYQPAVPIPGGTEAGCDARRQGFPGGHAPGRPDAGHRWRPCLAVTALAATIANAQKARLSGDRESISRGCHLRRDIGRRAIGLSALVNCLVNCHCRRKVPISNDN